MATVMRSRSFAASAEAVWAIIGDFGDLGGWHPAVVKQTNEGDVRHLEIPDGAVIDERLLGTDAHAYAYEILGGPLPVSGYRSVLAVAPSGAGSTVVWSATFEPAADGAADVVAGIYEAGLDALAQRLG